jgi:ribA/ribD-fused uncharacterized protein
MIGSAAKKLPKLRCSPSNIGQPKHFPISMGGSCRICVDGRWKSVKSTDNFALMPMKIDGKIWQTCEAYFQAMKFDPAARDNPRVAAHVEAIRLARNPGEAWRLGQSRKFKLRSDWETVKAHVMLTAVRAKYAQHPNLAAELIRHQGAVRAPASTANWQTINGMIIERVREELSRAAGVGTLSNERMEELVRKTDPMVDSH